MTTTASPSRMPVAALFSCSIRAVTQPLSRTAVPASPSSSVRPAPAAPALPSLASVIGETPLEFCLGRIVRVRSHVRGLLRFPFGRQSVLVFGLWWRDHRYGAGLGLARGTGASAQALRLCRLRHRHAVAARVAEPGLPGEAQPDHGRRIPH